MFRICFPAACKIQQYGFRYHTECVYHVCDLFAQNLFHVVVDRRMCSTYPVYTDHIALWIVFVVCAGVLFDRLCKCICFKWRFHEVLRAVLFSDKSGAVSGYYGEFRRQRVTVWRHRKKQKSAEVIFGALLLWSGNQVFSVKAATLHAGKREVKLLVPTVMSVNGFGST